MKELYFFLQVDDGLSLLLPRAHLARLEHDQSITMDGWSRAQCVGTLAFDHKGSAKGSVELVRNPGGGSSNCCSMYPEAAPARVAGRQFDLRLFPRENGWVSARNGARVYTADSCTEGDFADGTRYSALQLIGKTLSVDVDLSAVECGCNAAFYLVSMAQNAMEPGNCGGDYYCDANVVCGVRCTEVDLIEANKHAFHSTLHNEWDGNGVAAGVGGGKWDLSGYGPFDGAAIDTRRTFRVHSWFQSNDGVSLDSLVTTLTQGDSRANFAIYNGDGAISAALRAGMTPTFSYWSASDMTWLSSGVECFENQDLCGDTVTFQSLALCDHGGPECYYTPRPPSPPTPPPPPPLPPATPPPPPSDPLPPTLPPPAEPMPPRPPQPPDSPPCPPFQPPPPCSPPSTPPLPPCSPPAQPPTPPDPPRLPWLSSLKSPPAPQVPPTWALSPDGVNSRRAELCIASISLLVMSCVGILACFRLREGAAGSSTMRSRHAKGSIGATARRRTTMMVKTTSRHVRIDDALDGDRAVEMAD